MPPVARFQLMNGLDGCYMPDNHQGPYEVTRRRELISAVRDQLEWLEFPKAAIRQVRWTKVWRAFKFARSFSSIHLSITHKGYALEICGLTEDEAREMENHNDA